MYYTLRLPRQLSLTNRALNETLRRREPVLRVLFTATFIVLSLSLIVVSAEYFSNFNTQTLNRTFSVGAALLTVIGLRVLLAKRHYFVAGYGLLGIYWLLATIMTLQWGINLPAVPLLYSAVIVLSGIILGASYSLLALIGSVIILFAIQIETVKGHIHPNFTWRQEPTHLSDLILYYFVFVILGISSWLFNRQTDRSLHLALKAESALQREKATLEMKVLARTQELEKVQADKIRQLHRFAELGQFSTSLLHDLSNHVTTLSVDIEGMTEQQSQSQMQLRIQRRIAYIDAMVQWAHDHINGKIQDKRFDATHEIREALKILQYNANKVHVKLVNTTSKATPLHLYGDPNRFRQVVANLVSNAIDAYETAPADNKCEIHIDGSKNTDDSICIAVRDWGGGIPKDAQAKIFDPFYTSKTNGMGIGLFVVKQIVEEYFDGSIKLVSQKGETCFTITLKRIHE